MAACWACGAIETRPYRKSALPSALTPDDLRITDARYGTTLTLARCPRCGFVFADDPRTPELPALYAALDDPDYESGEESRARQMRWLLRACLVRRPGAVTLLDVGAASGLLVKEAAREGLRAVGVEPSASLSARARKLGANVVTGALPHPDLAGRTFDLVLLVDVIEHVADPVGLLGAAAAALAPGGLLVVVTPDLGSVTARLLGRRWWHFRVAHVGYFARRSFEAAARRARLRVTDERRALWFFPVGYLAERLARYVPPLRWGGGLADTPLGARLGHVVVPLNLLDSSVFFLSRE
jgi:2-polyprenyl-3-methyl-5-hydroxy-6-metoxy-1,4-benzoquinol methylase